MNIKEIGRFMVAGNAVFRYTNHATKKQFVYKVKQAGEEPRWNVMVRCEIAGERDFGYIGMIKARQFRHTARSFVTDESDEFDMFEFLFLHVIRGKELPKNREFEHMGRCGRCGRLLVEPDSVERGLGPKCAEMQA